MALNKGIWDPKLRGTKIKGTNLKSLIYWVPVPKSLYNFILSVTQGPTIWVPGLLGKEKSFSMHIAPLLKGHRLLWDPVGSFGG